MVYVIGLLKFLLRRPLWAVAAAFIVAACGGGDGVGSGGTGVARFYVTDAPACGFDEVNVTIEKVRVHKSASAGANDAGWSEVVLDPAKRVDLLSLTNGVLEELGQTVLPAGQYTQLRLVLGSNGGAAPFANSVVLSGSTGETPLDTPSGPQTGLKLNVNLTIEADQVADFVLDFDACKSVVRAGASGRYLLKPVVAVIPVVSSVNQRVIGHVHADIALGSTTVSLQRNGVVAKATPPQASGEFVLFPVPLGSYDLVVSANGRATTVMTGVPVTETAITVANPASAPIAPPPSVVRSAFGSVSVGGSNADTDAVVAAAQTLGVGGPTVEVAAQPVDALSGAYALALPAGAPQLAAHVPGGGTPSFSAVGAAAGLYTLGATVASATPQSVPIDVGAADAQTLFVFP